MSQKQKRKHIFVCTEIVVVDPDAGTYRPKMSRSKVPDDKDWLDCPDCMTKGVCRECDGFGKACYRFSGDRPIQCMFCDGTGICRICDGTGIVIMIDSSNGRSPTKDEADKRFPGVTYTNSIEDPPSVESLYPGEQQETEDDDREGDPDLWDLSDGVAEYKKALATQARKSEESR